MQTVTKTRERLRAAAKAARDVPVMTLVPKKAQRLHPRAQVQSLRRVAQAAMRKGDIARAQQAIDEMAALDREHQLGYGVPNV